MKCNICQNSDLKILSNCLRMGTGTVYYCPNCNYGMLEPNFTNAEEYYDNEYRKKFTDILNGEEEQPEEIYRTRCQYQKDRINILQKYYDKKKSFLEIGCSAGQFLSEIIHEFDEVCGLELSKSCAAYVHDKWNIPVYEESIQNISWNKKFDYIAFFQVLEHIENPLDFMEHVRELLNDNGRVFFEVPNLDDPLLKLWDVPAYETFYYHEAHLSYFSELSLKKLLELAHMEIDEIYFTQDYNMLNNLFWYFNDKPQSSCDFGLQEPHIEFRKETREVIKAGKEINELLCNTNHQYFKILEKYKLTSNIFIVAKKK